MLTAEEKVEKARDVLIELFHNNDLDRDDLDEKLRDAEMRPFGGSHRRRVTVNFFVGAESEWHLERFNESDIDLEDWVTSFNEDADEVVILTEEPTVELGPILRGNLPL